MSLAASFAVAVVALLHLYFAWFEMFAWTTKGPRIFSRLPESMFGPTKFMAANQGLYNGFLAAGLIWSLLIQDAEWQQRIAICFLLFAAAAGAFGALTATGKLLFVQFIPAVIAVILVVFI